MNVEYLRNNSVIPVQSTSVCSLLPVQSNFCPRSSFHPSVTPITHVTTHLSVIPVDQPLIGGPGLREPIYVMNVTVHDPSVVHQIPREGLLERVIED